jgi:hypothetical protein
MMTGVIPARPGRALTSGNGRINKMTGPTDSRPRPPAQLLTLHRPRRGPGGNFCGAGSDEDRPDEALRVAELRRSDVWLRAELVSGVCRMQIALRDDHRRSSGRGGPPQFPPPPYERSAPHTPGSPSRLHSRICTASMAFTVISVTRLSLTQPEGRPLTTPQASRDATDRSPMRGF